MTDTNKLYNTHGSFSNKSNVPQNYNVPKGSPMYYGQQESLLNLPDNSTGTSTKPAFYGGPSPYDNPKFNYGFGPQAANIEQQYNSAPNKVVFSKKPTLREPTPNNPMMNVSPLDYGMEPVFDNYDRYLTNAYPSKNNQDVKELVKTNFEKGLFQDADSMLWERTNSQRQFVSAPVGSVPNNQGEYASWLWGLPGTCKMGSVFQKYGVKYTDDSLLCTAGHSVPPMTNKGLLGGKLMSSVEGGSRN
jgi:hypothetical protein